MHQDASLCNRYGSGITLLAIAAATLCHHLPPLHCRLLTARVKTYRILMFLCYKSITFKIKDEQEVFAYGSVPLKTYLPDGDIDLSAIGASTDELVRDIASLLESEGNNSSAEFVVKDVQLIGAEVKLVKCMVQNLVVDISVNQIGGLCTLCFLEQVLYKFLEYFSAFDWDKYGISIMGPIRLSELPRIVVERPPNSNNLLLKVGFLRHCSKTLSVPMRSGDVFSKKHLNIVDPLNDHNNLGRSVSQGNFFRIRSAFGYGARKLAEILMTPEDNLTKELLSFFSNTLNMHGSGQRPDLPDDVPRSFLNVSISGAEKTFTTRVSGKPRSSNDENSYEGSGFPGNRFSSEGKDVSALMSSSTGEAANPVSIPFYAPHLLFDYSKLVNKEENGDIDDAKQSEVHETGVNLAPSEPLDLTGDLMSHLVCLEHVRWWNSYVLGPPMMGPPPPPPPILLSMIASEHGGVVRHPQFHPSDQMFMPRSPFVPNDPNPRGTMTYFTDMNRSRHGYHTKTSNATNKGTSNPTDFITPPEGVAGFGLVGRPTPPHREPLLHRRHQNHNRACQQDGTQRPRSVSGMDRFNVQSSYHLKDEDDFPPLSA
ncbi:PAP/25A-associated [Cynara cardunculus var. scolymus]|uniref:PAP/25A-associated n=1 Tax=Cynara cardunculus var. scolymus TaxID=59895 RepID=A0A124SI12_CYNCS|nr:PAP/25A-associated [Cynara cardunculus var. scolymus]